MVKPYSLTWLSDTLKRAGLKVQEVPGWQTRGRGDMRAIKGVMLHHTAGSSVGNMPDLNLLIRGRSDLPGPLAQLGLARDGTWHVIAAGRANHAGKGAYAGVTNGNSHFIGIEAANTGRTQGPRAEAWPPAQMESYKKGVIAILKYINAPVKMAIGHKEWAPRRKIDPTFDMNKFREDLEREIKNVG